MACFEERKDLIICKNVLSFILKLFSMAGHQVLPCLPSQVLQGLRNLPYGVIGESSVGKSEVKLQAQQQSHEKGWRAARQLEQLS